MQTVHYYTVFNHIIILSFPLNQNGVCVQKVVELLSIKFHRTAFSSYRIVICEHTLGQTCKKLIEASFQLLFSNILRNPSYFKILVSWIYQFSLKNLPKRLSQLNNGITRIVPVMLLSFGWSSVPFDSDNT